MSYKTNMEESSMTLVEMTNQFIIELNRIAEGSDRLRRAVYPLLGEIEVGLITDRNFFNDATVMDRIVHLIAYARDIADSFTVINCKCESVIGGLGPCIDVVRNATDKIVGPKQFGNAGNL